MIDHYTIAQETLHNIVDNHPELETVNGGCDHIITILGMASAQMLGALHLKGVSEEIIREELERYIKNLRAAVDGIIEYKEIGDKVC